MRSSQSAGDEQDRPGIGVLGERVVDRLLCRHRILGGPHRKAVLVDVDLASLACHHQAPVGGRPVFEQLLAGKPRADREALGIGAPQGQRRDQQEPQNGQTAGQPSSRGSRRGGEDGRGHQVQDHEEGDGLKRREEEAEDQPAGDVAQRVEDIDVTDLPRIPPLRDHRREEGQKKAGDQAVGAQQHERGQEDLADTQHQARQDQRLQEPDQRHLDRRREGDGRLAKEQPANRVSDSIAVAAGVAAQARQEQPVSENDPDHQLVAGKDTQELAQGHDLGDDR